MDNKKIGEFIRILRTEKNMTQEELAKLIHIGREAVSKWERGVNKPDKSTINILCDIFNISVEELLLGKRIKSDTKPEESKKLTLDLYEDRNKSKKIIKVLIFIVMIILMLFLSYYFFNNYNSIKVYTINYSDAKITIKDGIFTTTHEKMYFTLGNISSKKTIKNIKIYFKENNNETLIYKTDDKYITLYDYYGYDNCFEYKKLNTILNNTYVDIIFNDEIYTIKLKFTKDFANNHLFNKKVQKITNNLKAEKETNLLIDPNKIKEKFTPKEDYYFFKNKKYNIIYLENDNIINMQSTSKDKTEEWTYYLDNNILEYQEYDKDKIFNYFSKIENDYECKIENCKEIEEKANYFFDELNKILS